MDRSSAPVATRNLKPARPEGYRRQGTADRYERRRQPSSLCSLWPVAPVNICAKNAEATTKEFNRHGSQIKEKKVETGTVLW